MWCKSVCGSQKALPLSFCLRPCLFTRTMPTKALAQQPQRAARLSTMNAAQKVKRSLLSRPLKVFKPHCIQTLHRMV
ncbi:MAG: hypothetical protein LBO67_01360 [Spirochaetaceae bacterium]|nr:hypothetical protein [Spirochaetaceae bacterium]